MKRSTKNIINKDMGAGAFEECKENGVDISLFQSGKDSDSVIKNNFDTSIILVEVGDDDDDESNDDED